MKRQKKKLEFYVFGPVNLSELPDRSYRIKTERLPTATGWAHVSPRWGNTPRRWVVIFCDDYERVPCWEDEKEVYHVVIDGEKYEITFSYSCTASWSMLYARKLDE